jgi:uncharacterized integral membrane protein
MEPENKATPTAEKKTMKLSKGASRETLYRVTIQNQLRSIAIADQKANIIIGINTILISIIIAVIGLESNVVQLNFISNLNLSLPLSIMVLACFISGVIAVFVVRPAASLWTKETGSRLFFRDYQHCSLDDFLKDISTILESRSAIYESLNIDMYLYGQTVQRKFRLLRHAYIVFLIGLTLAVLSFFALRMINPDFAV